MGSTHLRRLLLLRIIGRRKCEGAWRGGLCSQLTSIKKDVAAIDWLAQCDTHMRAAPRERDSTTPFRIPRIGNQILTFSFSLAVRPAWWPIFSCHFEIIIIIFVFFWSFWFCLPWRAVCVIDHSEDRRVRFGLFVRGGKGYLAVQLISVRAPEALFFMAFEYLSCWKKVEGSVGDVCLLLFHFPSCHPILKSWTFHRRRSFLLLFWRSFVCSFVRSSGPGWGGFLFLYRCPAPFVCFFSFHYSPLSGRYCVGSGEKK